MNVQLRIVLDRTANAANCDEAEAGEALAGALIDSAPRGCDVAAILPAGVEPDISGFSQLQKLRLSRSGLQRAWSVGIPSGNNRGMIHSSSLLAPLARHDRVNDLHQIVVTVWDTYAWDDPDRLTRAEVLWQKTMLKRAVRHADAVVVPTHSIASRVQEIAPGLRDRLKVIAGAPVTALVGGEVYAKPADFPDDYIVLTGRGENLRAGFKGASDLDCSVVVLGAEESDSEAIRSLAASEGLSPEQVYLPSWLSVNDRLGLISHARVLVATDTVAAWPWRMLEALALGTPVVAVDTPVHRDVLAEGGLTVPLEEIPGAVAKACGDSREWLEILALDRSRAFSWLGAAEQVWQLHADL